MNAEETAVGMDRDAAKGIWISLKEWLGKTAPVLTAALVSGLMNRAVLPGGYVPFGAGFMAAVPQRYAAAAAVGGVISCLTGGSMLTSIDGLRKVSALLAVCGIRWAFGELRRVNRAKFYPFFAALAGVLMTGTVISGTMGTVFSYATVYYLMEGIMAGLSAMFFAEACRAAERFGSGEGLSRMASASLVITLCAAAIPLCRMRMYGISPGMTLLHTAVLLVSAARKERGGAPAGIAGGCVALFARAGTVQGIAIPVAALLAGYASVYGRIFAASAYIACCFLTCLTAGSMHVFFVAESAIGGALSCLIPAEAGERALAAAGFGRREVVSAPSDSRAADRLHDASEAIGGIWAVLGKVSDGLEKRSLPDDDGIYSRAVSEVCGKCALRDGCLGDGGSESRERIRRLAEKLKKGRSVSGGEISAALGKKCLREDELAGEINRGYGYYLASRSASSRLSSFRSVVNGQLEGVGMMLEKLGREAADAAREDRYASARVAEALTAQGCDVLACSCRSEGGAGTALSVRLGRRGGFSDPAKIAEWAGACLGMVLQAACAARSSDMPVIELRQKRKFALVCAGAQHCCGGETLCGDAYDYFENRCGESVVLLSDGMGSGGRAAVEGALTCDLFRRLLEGGFDFDSAVKIVNSALMIKSEDETLSTADCLKVNLYNGRAVISKAGAAQSYHVRKGFVTRIDLPSLPLGILCETDTAQYTFTAEEGDMIVMLSDGVPTDESGWFEELLRSYAGQPPEAFAALLLQSAVSRRPAGEDDDITVVVGTVVSGDDRHQG